jgi:hypothetical protein
MSAKLVTLIAITANRGKGIEGDPIRNVTQFYTIDGRLVAETDHWKQPEFDCCDIFKEFALISRSPAARGE